MSELPPPSINVSPTEFSLFPGDVTDINIDLSNSHPTYTLIFKCKTTSPQRYLVRNRQGVIAPSCNTRIHITLSGSVPELNSTDQFQVEYRYITAAEAALIADGKASDAVSQLLSSSQEKGKKRLLCRVKPSASVTSTQPAPSSVASASPPTQPSGSAQAAPLPERRTETTAPVTTAPAYLAATVEPVQAPRSETATSHVPPVGYPATTPYTSQPRQSAPLPQQQQQPSQSSVVKLAAIAAVLGLLLHFALPSEGVSSAEGETP